MVSDVVVVGGGTAGCILASRLSEDPKRSVLLLEAGPDFVTTEELPADIQSAKYPPMSHDWGYVGTAGEGSASVLLPRGKIIGGSSSTNYCFAMRTRPADHDAWAALGLDGGGFEDVLPIYRAMENDQGGDEQWHGRDGLFHVTRPGCSLG
jgi:choline dehydrogenase